jgi:hypothetical protein
MCPGAYRSWAPARAAKTVRLKNRRKIRLIPPPSGAPPRNADFIRIKLLLPKPPTPFPKPATYLILQTIVIPVQESLMLFSIGNLITLGIVLIFFFVYHKLTANNRSLEKVKRLADKLEVQLNDYVGERAEELKHYGIDLDVQQNAAKIALEKLPPRRRSPKRPRRWASSPSALRNTTRCWPSSWT